VNSPTIPRRSAGVPGRALAWLTALTAALVAAFVAAPRALAALGPTGDLGDEQHLTAAVRSAFVGYWRSGGPGLTPDLEKIVEYWQRYHLTKVVFAAAALIVLVALAGLLWKAFLRAGDVPRRIGLAVAGSLASVLALVSLVAVMANVQGVLAPYASLMPMLIDGAPADDDLAGVLDQARQQLTDAQSSGTRMPPVLDMLVGEFGWYHVVMAVLAPIVAVAILVLSVLAWRRFATTRADRRTRRLLGVSGLVTATLALAFVLLTVANVGVAADPAPASLALLDGSY
jgi:hypothetical protein